MHAWPGALSLVNQWVPHGRPIITPLSIPLGLVLVSC